jgi:hypothetical protein
MWVGGQRHTPAALPPGKNRCPLYRRLGGPQSRAGQVRKISPPPGFDARTVQPVVSRYTDWAIPARSLYLPPGLTLSLLMYINRAACKARNFNVLYIWTYVWQRWKPSIFICCTMFQPWSQCRKLCCNTVVCKHLASYQGYLNYRWDLIR